MYTTRDLPKLSATMFAAPKSESGDATRAKLCIKVRGACVGQRAKLMQKLERNMHGEEPSTVQPEIIFNESDQSFTFLLSVEMKQTRIEASRRRSDEEVPNDKIIMLIAKDGDDRVLFTLRLLTAVHTSAKIFGFGMKAKVNERKRVLPKPVLQLAAEYVYVVEAGEGVVCSVSCISDGEQNAKFEFKPFDETYVSFPTGKDTHRYPTPASIAEYREISIAGAEKRYSSEGAQPKPPPAKRARCA
jgi:hypothetical protein